MRAAILLSVFGIAVVAAVPKSTLKIVGGSVTAISQYPSTASLLWSWSGSDYAQYCAGVILNNRAILSAAHCFDGDEVWQWRIRVGSSYANTGGAVHNVNAIILHQDFDRNSYDNDIAILQSATTFNFNNNVRPAKLAGAFYNLADGQPVLAVGWGVTSFGGISSETLRHVQIWTVNHRECRTRYADFLMSITDNMLCSGWLDVGGRDQCQGDSGGPLYHNDVVVGLCSWVLVCGDMPRYPGVNTRVSRYTSWIQRNA